MENRKSSLENLEVKPAPNDFWHDRRVFVTGATGMVGFWLVKDLIAVGARVIALVRKPDPEASFYRSGDHHQVSLVQGNVEDFTCLEQALKEHEVDTVFHLAAQPIVSVANRNPLATFETNIRGHLQSARSVSCAFRFGETHRHCLQLSGLRPAGETALH